MLCLVTPVKHLIFSRDPESHTEGRNHDDDDDDDDDDDAIVDSFSILRCET